MHYRITKVHHEKGNRKKLVEVLESKKKILNSFDKLFNLIDIAYKLMGKVGKVKSNQ